MAGQAELAFGDVLASRYVLQDQVSESLGVRNWRATDLTLHRNVRVELLRADDPRAENFVNAAQRSTMVTDHRFLPVLDVLTDEQGFHAVIREWARATPLHLLLAQAPLPNARSADLVAELAEAIAHAHSLGVHHRRLTPHQVLLKQSGAVRIVGLGVQTALAPPEQEISESDIERFVSADVQAIGKVLYACLVGRWPGGHVDGLRAAPTEHGHLMRPGRVRAGISRRLDRMCDRILAPERHPRDALTDAQSIATELREMSGFQELPDPSAETEDGASRDLLRLDPVVIPSGPPPGLEPPRRKPRALQARKPRKRRILLEQLKSSTRGHRALLSLSVVLALLLVATLGILIAREISARGSEGVAPVSVEVLDVVGASDFDPQGEDQEEFPELAKFAIDGDAETAWLTSTYFGSPKFGGLKDGVGLTIDLGLAHEVHQIRVSLQGRPTDLDIRVSPSTASKPPGSLSETSKVASVEQTGEDVVLAFSEPEFTRFVTVWIRSLPEVAPNEFRAGIRQVVIRGR